MQTRHLILAAVAAKEGITVTQGQVDAFVKNAVDTQSGALSRTGRRLVTTSNIPASQVQAARATSWSTTRCSPRSPRDHRPDGAVEGVHRLHEAVRGRARVQVAPRYGTWNVFALGPVPNDLSFVPAAPASGARRPAAERDG